VPRAHRIAALHESSGAALFFGRQRARECLLGSGEPLVGEYHT
jgi:hypothetical protein